MNILYIEDGLTGEYSFRELMGDYPEVDFETSADLNELPELMRENKFNLVLLSNCLSSLKIKCIISHLNNTPLFVVSELENETQINELYEYGIFGHFKTPLTKRDLKHMVSLRFTSMMGLKKEERIAEEKETILDLTYLNKIVEGAEHLRVELIGIFISIATKEAEDIRHWYVEKEWNALCFSFHKIRSNLRMMGLLWLAHKSSLYEDCCSSLENLELVGNELDWFLAELKKGVLQAELFLEESELESVKKTC